jgi:hypothetical protein
MPSSFPTCILRYHFDTVNRFDAIKFHDGSPLRGSPGDRICGLRAARATHRFYLRRCARGAQLAGAPSQVRCEPSPYNASATETRSAPILPPHCAADAQNMDNGFGKRRFAPFSKPVIQKASAQARARNEKWLRSQRGRTIIGLKIESVAGRKLRLVIGKGILWSQSIQI